VTIPALAQGSGGIKIRQFDVSWIRTRYLPSKNSPDKKLLGVLLTATEKKEHIHKYLCVLLAVDCYKMHHY
jgi:hypothetical protein